MSTSSPHHPRPLPPVAGLAVLALATLLGALVGTARSEPAGGGWYEGAQGYERALEEAKKSGRPLAVYFYTDWCGFCRKLERDVLTQPPMQPCLSSIIPVRVNPEAGPKESALGMKFRVSGFPRFFISRPEVGVVTTIPNATLGPGGRSRLKSSEEFAADCQKALGG